MSNSSEAAATAASTQPWGSTSVRPDSDRRLGNFKDKTQDADERDPDARGSADQPGPGVPDYNLDQSRDTNKIPTFQAGSIFTPHNSCKLILPMLGAKQVGIWSEIGSL